MKRALLFTLAAWLAPASTHAAELPTAYRLKTYEVAGFTYWLAIIVALLVGIHLHRMYVAFMHAARCSTDDRSDWKATRGPN